MHCHRCISFGTVEGAECHIIPRQQPTMLSHGAGALQAVEGRFRFQASWKDTCVHLMRCSKAGCIADCSAGKRRCSAARVAHEVQACHHESRLRVSGVYSDVLFQVQQTHTRPVGTAKCFLWHCVGLQYFGVLVIQVACLGLCVHDCLCMCGAM